MGELELGNLQTTGLVLYLTIPKILNGTSNEMNISY